MPQRTGSKGCLYRHKSSQGLTLTRRRSVGRQGAQSPRTGRRLVVMFVGEKVAAVDKISAGRREEVEHACTRK